MNLSDINLKRMSLRNSDRIDINEQRKNLNKLDLEIEKAIQGTFSGSYFNP
jgi:hypothetical protein